MTARFFALLTNIGAAKLANVTALGTCLEITQMAVGDGGGILPTPNPAQIKLVNEQRRAALNMLTVDPVNTSQIIAEQVIPETEGGWWIREIGLLDKDGDLIAIANCAETYKPQLQEGSGRTQTIRVILIVSSTAAVTLKIDPSVVLATRKYVDDRVIEVKTYADELMAAHLAAVDPHSQYAPKASPALTGKPTAPTPANSDNSKKLATTEFVSKALAALAGSAPETLDTLKELADALGNDPNFATTVLNKLAEKLAKDQNGADIPDPALFVKNLALGEGSALPVGVPVPWPSATPPTGWLKCNGAAFTTSQYPKLALAYPALRLPDLRGEFIRGWDDTRGVNPGRKLLSPEGDAFLDHDHEMITRGPGEGNEVSPPNEQGVTSDGDNYLIGAGIYRTYKASRSGDYRTASETRPRNVAFNYIVRAV